MCSPRWVLLNEPPLSCSICATQRFSRGLVISVCYLSPGCPVPPPPSGRYKLLQLVDAGVDGRPHHVRRRLPLGPSLELLHALPDQHVGALTTSTGREGGGSDAASVNPLSRYLLPGTTSSTLILRLPLEAGPWSHGTTVCVAGPWPHRMPHLDEGASGGPGLCEESGLCRLVGRVHHHGLARQHLGRDLGGGAGGCSGRSAQ